MSSEYQHVISGGLKLKAAAGVKKKKESLASEDKRTKSNILKLLEASNPSSSSTKSDLSKVKIKIENKTPSERAFEEIQRKRIKEQSKKLAMKSHKEKVAEFNKQLESMSEHYDVPKVTPPPRHLRP